ITPDHIGGNPSPIDEGLRPEDLLMEADDREGQICCRILGDSGGQRCMLRPRTPLEGANVVGVQEILHGWSPASSGGRSEGRNARPCSGAYRKVDSSEIEPVTSSSQLVADGDPPSRR